ncbi:MAG TPA: lactate racemase domain-containing protein [Desulfomonilaceae bacterium]|nr:lactate racemase domain-containing protein [Desulfomonilaceae bacterium]
MFQSGYFGIRLTNMKEEEYRRKAVGKDYYLYSSRHQKVFFSLPPQWSLAHFIESREDVPIPSVEQMAQEALETPLEMASLKDLVSGAKKVAILVDDWTRPTPVADILQVLLPYLVRNGLAREKITIVIALGTHVNLTQEELVERVGRSTASLYRIIQHDAWQHDLVPILLHEDGLVVKINPEVAQADVKIGMSSILPCAFCLSTTFSVRSTL